MVTSLIMTTLVLDKFLLSQTLQFSELEIFARTSPGKASLILSNLKVQPDCTREEMRE